MDEDAVLKPGPVFDLESLQAATVGVGLVTGPFHRLREHNQPFGRTFDFWRVGQEAGVALAGPALRPVLRALDLAGTQRSTVLVDVPGSRPEGAVSRTCVVTCIPVRIWSGRATLMLAAEITTRVLGAGGVREEAHEAPADAVRRYEALLSAIPHVVWLMAKDGSVSALVGRFGQDSSGLWNPDGTGSWMDAVHPNDRAWFEAKWRATSNGQSLLDAVIRVRQAHDPDSYRHVKIIAVPVLKDGELVEWIGTVSDAEEQWHKQMRERLLAKVAAGPVAADLAELFAGTAEAVVPDLVDAFAVFQLHDDDSAARDPGSGLHLTSRVRIARSPSLPPMPSPGDDFVLGPLAEEAIAQGRARVVRFPTGEPPEGLFSAATRGWLARARGTSLTLLPVTVEGRAVAIAAAATCQGNPPPSDAEVDLLQEVLHRAQGPVSRTLELQNVRDTALALQRSFLAAPPPVDGAELAAVYQPASSRAEIGGDWYDATACRDGSLTLTIGDVAGHDLNAATAMGKISTMLRGFAYDSPESPAQTLCRLDRVTQGLGTSPYVTILHAVLTPAEDGGRNVVLSNAGHLPPLLIPAGHGVPRYLAADGGPDLPLCVAPGVRRGEWRERLGRGDTLLLFTDGLVETPGEDIEEGLGRLASRAADLAAEGLSLPALIKELLTLPAERRDDIAIIGLRVTDDPPSPARASQR
ncbi:SpoIIE family protein phosphatase [Streptomyces sp. SDT5-1]|uniref:SpoIIE family protein phosphatase n=1 Tax=Streptomyces sp. SDT5-1 TaxID=3406418 RepID=UPI003FCF0ADD